MKYCIIGPIIQLDAILYQEPIMPLDTKLGERLSTLFLEQPCWMIKPLAVQLRYSIPSVRRFLIEVGYYS